MCWAPRAAAACGAHAGICSCVCGGGGGGGILECISTCVCVRVRDGVAVCGFCGPGGVALAEALKINQTVTTLNLGGVARAEARAGSAGARAGAAVASGHSLCPHAQCIERRASFVTALADALKVNKALTTIRMDRALRGRWA